MKILLVGSEVAPIIKFGGLGDVIGALPKALSKIDVKVDVIVPFFSVAKTNDLNLYKKLDLSVPYNDSMHNVELWTAKLPGSDVDVLLLKNAEYFSRYSFINPNGSLSDTEVFSFFNRCVVEYIKSQFNTYDVVHCNDWHTGLINHILEEELGDERPGTLLTIHNIMYQGISSLDIVKKSGLTISEHPIIEWDIADGDLNMLQQGIASSDYLSTVSESYAQEILTPEYGGFLNEILNSRTGRLVGILNGIDYSAFPRSYNESNWSVTKSKIKDDLISKLHLGPFRGPLCSFIGRLDANQKGLDILYECVDHIKKLGGALVLLGSGDPVWEKKFKDLECPTVSINLKFDIELAKTIYSGSDFLIVPSKYEPCGLIQMIAMWYGTLPIVHDVGGLKDSVIEGINGFKFPEYSSKDLILALDKAFSAYNGHDMSKMIVNAINADFSWDKSAKKYKDLYTKVLSLSGGIL